MRYFLDHLEKYDSKEMASNLFSLQVMCIINKLFSAESFNHEMELNHYEKNDTFQWHEQSERRG